MLTPDELSRLEAVKTMFCEARDYVYDHDLKLRLMFESEPDPDMRRTANALEEILDEDNHAYFYIYKPILKRVLEPDIYEILHKLAEEKKLANLQRPKRQAVDVLASVRTVFE